MEFTVKGSVVKQTGWRAVYGEEKEEITIPGWQPASRFIAGLPIKLATNRLAGFSYTSTGVPICSATPPFITITRWAAHRDGDRVGVELYPVRLKVGALFSSYPV